MCQFLRPQMPPFQYWFAEDSQWSCFWRNYWGMILEWVPLYLPCSPSWKKGMWTVAKSWRCCSIVGILDRIWFLELQATGAKFASTSRRWWLNVYVFALNFLENIPIGMFHHASNAVQMICGLRLLPRLVTPEQCFALEDLFFLWGPVGRVSSQKVYCRRKNPSGCCTFPTTPKSTTISTISDILSINGLPSSPQVYLYSVC